MIQSYIREEEFINQDGIWFASDCQEISYPENVRDMLFSIEDKSFWFAHRNCCIIETIKRIAPEGTIFDIGGGNGFVTKGLINAGFDAILIEPAVKGAYNATKRGGGVFEVICAPFNKHYFKECSASAVALFDVLEHIENDARFLKEVYELMQTNAFLYATVPAHMALWSHVDVQSGHFRRYSVRSLKRLLKCCGFEIVHDSYFFSYLSVPSFILRGLPYRLGIKRKPINQAVKAELVPLKIVSNVLNWLSELELDRLHNGGRIQFGSSIIIVARKINRRKDRI